MTKSPKYTSIVRKRACNVKIKALEKKLEETRDIHARFFHALSFELRTPLNAIIGFSQLMLDRPEYYDIPELPELYKDDLATIYNNGRRLSFFIHDTLDLALVELDRLQIDMQKQSVDYDINAIVDLAKNLSQKSQIDLIVKISDSLPLLYVDRKRLRQILFSLYHDAIIHTTDSVTLEVSENDNNQIQFALSDTGRRIKPYIRTLQEQFNALDEGRYSLHTHGGSGLVLSYQLVKLMGGKLWIESIEEQGMTVYFTLQKHTGQE